MLRLESNSNLPSIRTTEIRIKFQSGQNKNCRDYNKNSNMASIRTTEIRIKFQSGQYKNY